MISLLVVNYRAASLALDAIRSARAASSQPLEVVVVDNSLDPAEATLLRPAADVLIIADRNRGYGGGNNLGRAACRGDVIVIANPDVVFAPGSIDLLVAQLSKRAPVAGPALFWDEALQWMLPPADVHDGLDQAATILASRSPAFLASRDRGRFLHRVRFWSALQPMAVPSLSGAVLAIRTDVFDELRGFDERFSLYFEETDLLRRLRATHRNAQLVPHAHCRHLFNQSAGQVPEDASARYAQSELRYLEKWNGPLLARAFKALEKPVPVPAALPFEGVIRFDRDDVVVEASPLATFVTAAGHFPIGREVTIPDEVWSAYRGPELFLRTVVRSSGQVLATYRAGKQ